MLELNLPTYPYRLEQRGGKLAIFDPIRKKFVVLSPEEWVRQHFVNYLNNHLGYPASLTSVEMGMKYNQLRKRSDIIVMGKDLTPLVLVECKAPSVAVNDATVRQLAVYNSVCKAKLLVVTNGMVTYAGIMHKGADGFNMLAELPTYPLLIEILEG